VVSRRLSRGSGFAGGRPPVVPVTLFTPGSPIHKALVGYKSGRDRAERTLLSRDLAQLVSLFLSRHSICLARMAGGGWDRIDVVPSTRRATQPHPFARALTHSPLLAQRQAGLLRRGDATVDHLLPDRRAFAAPPARSRVLLLDDVFTTGARAFSAAHALQTAGAEVVAIVPVGRMVHVDDSRTSRWWSDAFHARSAAEWWESPCCVE
jgi:hypothetical protein